MSPYFYASKENFPDTERGINFVALMVSAETEKRVTIFPAVKPRSVICDEEYIYQDLQEFEKFKDSKILVVCGGPSAKEYDWDFNDYDYVFSCNHFYKMDKLKEEEIAVYFLGNEVNINEEDFTNYFNKHKQTLIAVEELSQGEQIRLKNLVNAYSDRVFTCSSRWQAKLTGMGAKVIIFALCLEPREVHYVGLDGITEEFSTDGLVPHSFEKSKIFRKTKENREEILEQYRFFEEHINSTFIDTKIKNLGKTSKYNCFYENI
tara:strand:- start:1027 stop:1815 length:789 start_codon:yes stop_codon:yes gene_type:complete